MSNENSQVVNFPRDTTMQKLVQVQNSQMAGATDVQYKEKVAAATSKAEVDALFVEWWKYQYIPELYSKSDMLDGSAFSDICNLYPAILSSRCFSAIPSRDIHRIVHLLYCRCAPHSGSHGNHLLFSLLQPQDTRTAEGVQKDRIRLLFLWMVCQEYKRDRGADG